MTPKMKEGMRAHALVCSCSSYHRGQVRFGRWVAGAEVAEKIGTERTPRDSESAVPPEIFD